MRACPLCATVSGEDAVDFISRDGPIVRCPRCRMVYLDTARAETEWEELPDYIENFRAHADRLRQSKLAVARRVLAELEDARTEDGAVLEIGLGVGALAAAARERGWSYHAVEPCAPLVDQALEEGLIEPAEVTVGTLEEAELGADRFDAVVLVMVLEHLLSPLEAVERCLAALRPGGVLYVEVPNSRFFRRRTALRRRLGMSDFMPGHVNFFTPKTLEALLERAGASAVSTRAVSNFRRGEGSDMIDFYRSARWPLRLADAVLRRLPIDEWTGLALVLSGRGKRS